MREQLKESIIPRFMEQINGIDEDAVEDAIIESFIGCGYNENAVSRIIKDMGIDLDVETVTYLFEALLEKENVNENGIVFTPQYIANFICDSIWGELNEWSTAYKIIDPGCGCGIFLLSAMLYINRKFDIPISEIIKNNIYGIDLDVRNAKRCKRIIKAVAQKGNEIISDDDIHILCADSLKENWADLFRVAGFDYIIGNPPYVNTHDMNKETALFLKQNFVTTRTGVYNIFYAFIEKAMEFLNGNGKLGYIVPNNFLTIKAATDLREYLQNARYIERVIDFADNMVFKPVRTYNCIIILSKKNNGTLNYCVLEKTDDIKDQLSRIEYSAMPLEYLDKGGWKLVSHDTYKNLQKIEGQFRPIKEFIRTGIATLRDEVYMVNYANGVYSKKVNDKLFEIEPQLVKKIYKIPELKNCTDLEDVCRYIIFPYKVNDRGFEIIQEDELKTYYPNAYGYLSECKSVLDERDKGKPNTVAWYAYGRTQGLNKYGKKLLFPTFADIPKFMYVDDENALFCNGYGIFENDYMDLDELLPVLNSVLMKYYVSNTSYAIEGGYYCYQKKYIERFSVPLFTEEERELLRTGTQTQVDNFLIGKYEVQI